VLPSTEVRESLTRINLDYEDLVKAVAIVICGSGFRASAMRGLLTAMNLRVLRPRTIEMRTHADLDAVVAWLPAEHRRRIGEAVAPEELRSVLHQTLRNNSPEQ